MLGTLADEKKARWADYLPEMLHAYNNTVHSSTGYTPSYLMFGQHVRTPLDVMLGHPVDEQSTVEEWVRRHHERLHYAYRRAGELTGRAGQHQKKQHDNQGLLGPLMVGERVLVRNVGPKRQGKLANFWSRLWGRSGSSRRWTWTLNPSCRCGWTPNPLAVSTDLVPTTSDNLHSLCMTIHRGWGCP
ncbi:hypothetical protein SRHO_G00077670 [Serrasalmus rhombeus]